MKWRLRLESAKAATGEGLRRSLEWLRETYSAKYFYEVLKTASAEIAVLLFVFPLIDQLGNDNAGHKTHWRLIAGSLVIGLVFVLLAGVFARMEHESREE